MLLPTEDPIVIVGMSRTPMGAFQGELSELSASDLGAKAIHGAIRQAQIDNASVDEVMMGCVLPAGQGQAPARQAAIKAKLPPSVPCTTVNKMCGSGMKTVMLTAQALLAGTVRIGVAGGMESMTNAPYLLPKAREGYRLGHGQLIDHIFLDGLEDAYQGGLMGNFAELCAAEFNFSRELQDEYAVESLNRAMAAVNSQFDSEIVPVSIDLKSGNVVLTKDEQPFKARPEKIPSLRPAFKKDGTVTAANASSISDGAAALVMMRLSEAEARGLTPMAKLTGMTSFAQDPAWFTTAPIGAMQKLLAETSLDKAHIDLFEINEAFAVVPMAAMKAMDLPHEKVNVNGGACALGHPIGASGARILVTLINALHQRDLETGVASICIGGGEATAISLSRKI
ncbi:acetyl-CoA C-acyltransferase [Parvularcula sp. LCG005]|uniref:acetyl-CoA C-acyltransferase n=1 Tax=Parvularcula sp. LCG005 TaxID=3078805 RepID=UPI0029423A2A|nr:acetyl-CoA C-acyltransferase [Parvularcula sp. LCG005]WOI53425.1 acetyl-CoA C-acyltransferase [Parvularcula sp. LCG005]